MTVQRSCPSSSFPNPHKPPQSFLADSRRVSPRFFPVGTPGLRPQISRCPCFCYAIPEWRCDCVIFPRFAPTTLLFSLVDNVKGLLPSVCTLPVGPCLSERTTFFFVSSAAIFVRPAPDVTFCQIFFASHVNNVYIS